MSDFFRVPMDPELIRLSASQLAAKAHDAEDTDDDIAMVQIHAEIERREAECPRLATTERFRLAYIEQHKTRGKV